MPQKKFAEIVSIIGHPLLTFPIFIIVMLFLNESIEKAIWISILIFFGIFVPMFIKMFRGSKTGKYTNFDISDQKQRKSFYPFVILLLSAVILILYLTKQPKHILIPLTFGLVLILVSYMLNYFVKVSLHVSLSVFLSFLIFPIHPIIGITFLLFSLLIAWSRLELNRHTLKEIAFGLLVGFGVGTVFLLIQ